jgi:hypothetical protein
MSDPVVSNTPTVSAADPLATTEGSLAGRFVALLSPVFAIAAGWVAGAVATIVPGAHLDQTQIVSFMLAASTSALTATWKWLQGWQQHELLVAQGAVAPRKTASAPATAV